ncbi:MAG: hypothetical protein ACLFV7_04050 [Phycisphaerae bacterium]
MSDQQNFRPEGQEQEEEPISLESASDEQQPRPEPVPIPPPKKPQDEDEPISLVEMEEDFENHSQIKQLGIDRHKEAHKYSRPLNLDGTGATRCKIFFAKINPQSLEFIEDQINDWADANEVEIKHVTEVVGTMEGKRAEPNIVMTVWY